MKEECRVCRRIDDLVRMMKTKDESSPTGSAFVVTGNGGIVMCRRCIRAIKRVPFSVIKQAEQ